MARPDETDDLDALIDRAVDTFFVEAPSEEETLDFIPEPKVSPPPQAKVSPPPPPKVAPAPKPKVSPPPPRRDKTGGSFQGPSLDEAVDSLFMSSFQEPPAPTTAITSGDDETDREIDLAVDTLFVEELESPPPETTQLEVGESEVPDDEDFKRHVEEHARRTKKPVPVVEQAVLSESPADSAPSYDDAMAKEIQKHMHTLLEDQSYEPRAEKAAPPAKPGSIPKPKPPARLTRVVPPAESEVKTTPVSSVRKLQEAILTLEWEISRRSITVLANEIHKLRTRFPDSVVVDFAALSMRVVLEYVVKRMSRAHPESVRFLLEVSDYLDKSFSESEEDPLSSFHHILSRYERYKSVVRKAEGLPDDDPAILHQLEIRDAVVFYKMVDQQTKTIAKAGHSLARKLNKTKDPENLIRSFRFLVNRAVNRILENTLKEKSKKVSKKRK